jgi:hypothetical protein
MTDELYNIEKIVDKRYSEQSKCWIYLVKWEGFSEADNTWEPEENLVPLGKMLENFNNAWQAKNKPQAPKVQKSSDSFVKKPIVSKVKGLVELSEINNASKKLPERENPILSRLKATSKVPEDSKTQADDSRLDFSSNGSLSQASKTPRTTLIKDPKKLSKPKKPSEPKSQDFAQEESVKLISKKNFDKKNSSSKEVEIDISKNVFKSCGLKKGSLETQTPSKIIGCRKRNNMIQYVVLFRGPSLFLPAVVAHDDLIKAHPQLIADFLIESF